MKRLILVLLWLASPASAEFVLQLPLGATEVYSRIEPDQPPLVPITPFADGKVAQVDAPDRIRRTVWQLGGEQTLKNVSGTILRQLESKGYDVLLDCVAKVCGGFDFRFAIEVVDEPAMRVDLRNFRFITARQTVRDTPAYVTFLISRSPVAVYVQMTEYAPTTPDPVTLAEPSPGDTTQTTDPGLPRAGNSATDLRLVLEGLEFEPGSSRVSGDPLGSIAALAARMTEDPDLRVLLVGHSDMSGSLDNNIAVSRARAEAVRQVLIRDHGIDATRLSAHGVGFLVPRATNETEAGRQKNRRVEAVFSR